MRFTPCCFIRQFSKLATLLKIWKQFSKFMRRLLELKCFFSIISHANHEYCRHKVVVCAMELLLINNFNAPGGSSFVENIPIQINIWLQTAEGVDSGSLLPVIPWYTTLRYPHRLGAVDDMMCSMTIMNPTLSQDDIESLYILDGDPPNTYLTFISEPEFQVHLVSSSNSIVYPIIGGFNEHPAAISLLQHCALLC